MSTQQLLNKRLPSLSSRAKTALGIARQIDTKNNDAGHTIHLGNNCSSATSRLADISQRREEKGDVVEVQRRLRIVGAGEVRLDMIFNEAQRGSWSSMDSSLIEKIRKEGSRIGTAEPTQ